MHWRVLMFGILMAPVALPAQSVCPAHEGDAGPLQITETQLTAERYREAVRFLKEGLDAALKRHATTAELQDDLSFWIPYVNSLRAIEGYLLRQRAIYERGAEVEKFCEFLAKSNWSD